MKPNIIFLNYQMKKYGMKPWLNDSKAFIKYSNHLDDIDKNIEEYKPLASDKSSRFRKNLLEKNIKISHDKTTDEKLQYYIDKKATKTSALSSGKIDKYKYLTGKEILPSDQRRSRKKTSSNNWRTWKTII